MSVPPDKLGYHLVRYYDKGGTGDLDDPTAFWAYSPTVPRIGDFVATPDRSPRIASAVWFIPFPHPQDGTVYQIMGPWVELSPHPRPSDIEAIRDRMRGSLNGHG